VEIDAARVHAEKWTLSKESLDAFLLRLNSEREPAGREYENVRRKLLTFFRCNGCWDAEVLVDETIDRVIRRHGEVEIRELMPFIRGVARRVASEHHKAYREVPLEEVKEPSQRDPNVWDDEIVADAVRLKCLEECVKRLGPEDREMIVGYYMGEKGQKIENKRKLAQQFGITTAALRVRAFRVRERLQVLLAHSTHAAFLAVAPVPYGAQNPRREGCDNSRRGTPVSVPMRLGPLTAPKPVQPVEQCYGRRRESA